MDCPVCQQEMSLLRTDISHNSSNTKQYTRTLYTCSKDDVWAKVEVPVQQNDSHKVGEATPQDQQA